MLGTRAVLRVRIGNGDAPDIAGDVTLRYERAAWRIDDFGSDYLRSDLGFAVANQAGIVDPTKVTRSALQNAASIAGLMLTTEVMITKIDEEEPKNKVAGAIR